jgi:L,D-peptidoglycan transpeptidase YkuD (ErfK/YbiS/YcfS/YnhG family)
MSWRTKAIGLALVSAGGLVACAAHQPTPVPVAAAAPITTATTTTPALPTEVPGLGPATLAELPADTEQVVEVVGAGADSPTSHVVLYQHTAAGWQAGPTWPARNGLDGWSADHHNGDLRTPSGVYGITDAGGLLADPGTRLTYDRSHVFTVSGTGFDGESLAGAFDYVIAVNYNRKAGVSPNDWTMPLGAARGGHIWFHVDHGGPTHGCVSLPESDMITLLRTLDPAAHPVAVLGDAATLAH